MFLEELTLGSGITAEPNDANAVPELIQQLQHDLINLQRNEDATRLELLSKARELVQALETPRETMMQHCWAQIGAISALIFGVETGLWKVMAANGPQAYQVGDLASKVGVDPRLLVRLLRHLGAMGYVKETGVDEYESTNFTKSMAIDGIGNSYIVCLRSAAASLRLQEYSRERDFKNPEDSNDTSFMYVYNTDKHVFEWQESLGYGKHFSDHLTAFHYGLRQWMDRDVFPVEERLIHGTDIAADAPFLVDIGGNVGYDLVNFKAHHPRHPGKLILQDLPSVIGHIKDLDPSIIRMPYDFFTEQPIKGARAYYLHMILHDWPDSDCEKIIANTKAAMKPGYSKLLISENVIPDRGTAWEMTALDMIMLTRFSSTERSRTDWVDLIERKCGMKIVEIWDAGRGNESLIEVELS